jgi:hypothetical protein
MIGLVCVRRLGPDVDDALDAGVVVGLLLEVVPDRSTPALCKACSTAFSSWLLRDDWESAESLLTLTEVCWIETLHCADTSEPPMELMLIRQTSLPAVNHSAPCCIARGAWYPITLKSGLNESCALRDSELRRSRGGYTAQPVNFPKQKPRNSGVNAVVGCVDPTLCGGLQHQ